MAANVSVPSVISVEEYISRFIDANEKPACEYVDGELIPKGLVTRKHSQVQTNIIYLIRRLYGKTLLPLPELTTHIKETTFFLPDVAIEERSRPRQGRYPGPDDPVFLCVEVVSPPDRVGKLFGKCEEYHRWGVSYCWVIDPERKLAWEYFSADIEPRKVDGHLIKAGLIELALDDVFEDV